MNQGSDNRILFLKLVQMNLKSKFNLLRSSKLIVRHHKFHLKTLKLMLLNLLKDIAAFLMRQIQMNLNPNSNTKMNQKVMQKKHLTKILNRMENKPISKVVMKRTLLSLLKIKLWQMMSLLLMGNNHPLNQKISSIWSLQNSPNSTFRGQKVI